MAENNQFSTRPSRPEKHEPLRAAHITDASRRLHPSDSIGERILAGATIQSEFGDDATDTMPAEKPLGNAGQKRQPKVEAAKGQLDPIRGMLSQLAPFLEQLTASVASGQEARDIEGTPRVIDLGVEGTLVVKPTALRSQADLAILARSILCALVAIGSPSPQQLASPDTSTPEETADSPAPQDSGREVAPHLGLADRIRRQWPRKKRQARLVEFMEGRRSATYHDVAEGVYDDDMTEDNAIKALAFRTNDTLVELGAGFQFRGRAGHVDKLDLPT